MPVYEYECSDCGVFDELRTIADRDDPIRCPFCSALASRSLSTAPRLATMAASVRLAHTTNERSANEPSSTRDFASTPRRHGAGCSCCKPNTSAATAHNPDGSKTFPSRRPWMISH